MEPSSKRPGRRWAAVLAAVSAVLVLIVAVIALSRGADEEDLTDAGVDAVVQGEVLTRLARPTPLSVHEGWVVYSRFDGARYRLAVVAPDGTSRDLPAGAQDAPFDASIGPDSQGAPLVVFVRCDEGCDIRAVDPADPAEPRLVESASSPTHDEMAPSIRAGRIAFGRRLNDGSVAVYTRRLDDPASVVSTRLGGLPSSRCISPGGGAPCVTRQLRPAQLTGTAIVGRWVAQRWDYDVAAAGSTPGDPPAWDAFARGRSRHEIRLDRVDDGETRQLAVLSSGPADSGARLLGPSAQGDVVRWATGCLDDPQACAEGKPGVVTYPVEDPESTTIAALPGPLWAGWAATGSAQYVVPSPGALRCSATDGRVSGAETVPCTVTRQPLPAAREPIEPAALR